MFMLMIIIATTKKTMLFKRNENEGLAFQLFKESDRYRALAFSSQLMRENDSFVFVAVLFKTYINILNKICMTFYLN